MLLGHIAEALEAQRALVLMLGQVLKTFLVHSMPAIQEHTLVSAPEHVFEADRTVTLCHFVYVPVTVFDFY